MARNESGGKNREEITKKLDETSKRLSDIRDGKVKVETVYGSNGNRFLVYYI